MKGQDKYLMCKRALEDIEALEAVGSGTAIMLCLIFDCFSLLYLTSTCHQQFIRVI